MQRLCLDRWACFLDPVSKPVARLSQLPVKPAVGPSSLRLDSGKLDNFFLRHQRDQLCDVLLHRRLENANAIEPSRSRLTNNSAFVLCQEFCDVVWFCARNEADSNAGAPIRSRSEPISLVVRYYRCCRGRKPDNG